MIIEKAGINKGLQYVIAFKENLGFRMGYVAVPLDLEINERELYCHGGITYTGGNTGYPIKTDDDVSWIGFDCGHDGDGQDIEKMKEILNDENTDRSLKQVLTSQLQMLESFGTSDPVRDIEYVENECKNLIKQVNKLSKKYI